MPHQKKENHVSAKITENAVIESVSLDVERGVVIPWIFLSYDGGGQGAGGFVTYNPQCRRGMRNFDCTGALILRVCEVIGVDRWEKLPGRPCRSVHTQSNVRALGHHMKDKWISFDGFFESLRAKAQAEDES